MFCLLSAICSCQGSDRLGSREIPNAPFSHKQEGDFFAMCFACSRDDTLAGNDDRSPLAFIVLSSPLSPRLIQLARAVAVHSLFAHQYL